MIGTIIDNQQAAEFYFSERCYITELSNSELDPTLSVAKARVEPGITTCWHRLDGITERYVILEGQGLVEIGDIPPRTVLPGDVILIPMNSRQRISNTGTGDLVFLALCTPRFYETAYQNLEEIPA